MVYHLEHKTSKVSKDTGSSEGVSESLSAFGASALVPSAPVASPSSRGTPLTFTQPSVTTAAWPPPYSALPGQSLSSYGINAPLPPSPEEQINDGLADVNINDDDEEVFDVDNNT